MRVLSSVHLYACPCRGTIFLFSFLWVPGVDVAVSASVSIHMCLPGLCIYYQRPPWKGALFILCKRRSMRLLRWLWSPPNPAPFPSLAPCISNHGVKLLQRLGRLFFCHVFPLPSLLSSLSLSFSLFLSPSLPLLEFFLLPPLFSCGAACGDTSTNSQMRMGLWPPALTHARMWARKFAANFNARL